MDIERLKKHIRLCKRNLHNRRVKCCATCPFEEEILEHYPELWNDFVGKRVELKILEEHHA